MQHSTIFFSALRDRFGRAHDYLRISLTERCNLRCTYCMPENGVKLSPSENLLSEAEIIRLAIIFNRRCGVQKIRLTGGEPLLFKGDISGLINTLKNKVGITTVGLTTNGILLPRYLTALKNAKLDLINISLDTLKRDRFVALTRRNGLENVLEAIDMAHRLEFYPVKINCVVMRGINDTEVADMVRFFLIDKPFELRFIEYMPFEDNSWSRQKVVPFMEIMDSIETNFGCKLQPIATKGDSSVATMFKLPGCVGKIGFIPTVTLPSCSSCSRLRLTADGNLKNCLLGTSEWNLRELLRLNVSDDCIVETIQKALNEKHPSLGGNSTMENVAKQANRPMIKIGG